MFINQGLFMKKVFTKVLFLVFGAAVLCAAPLCAEDHSSRFNSVMQQMKQEIERKVADSSSGLFSLVYFSRGVNESCKIFGELCLKFDGGAFKDEHTKIHTTFEKFCSAVSRIDRKIKTPSDIKPWDVRCIQWYIEQLNSMANKAMKQKIQNDGNFQTAKLITVLHNNMLVSVCPILRTYIGTTFERGVIDRVLRAAGFYLGNWWWTIPATVALSKFTWDTCRYKEEPPVKIDPADWDLDTKTKPHKEINGTWAWYTKIIAAVAGTVFTGAVFKPKTGEAGWINTKGYGYYSGPIGQECQRGEYDIKQIKTTRSGEVSKISRKVQLGAYTKRQIPFQVQAGAMCGYYAIYAADCLKRLFENDTNENRRRFIDNDEMKQKTDVASATIIDYRGQRQKNRIFSNFLNSRRELSDIYNQLRAARNINSLAYLTQLLADGENDIKIEWNNLAREHKQTISWNRALHEIINAPVASSWLQPQEMQILIRNHFPHLWNNNNRLADNVFIFPLPVIEGAIYKNGKVLSLKKNPPHDFEYYRSRGIDEPQMDWIQQLTDLGVAIPLETIAQLRYEDRPNPLIGIVYTGGAHGHWRAFAIRKRGDEIEIFGTQSLGRGEILNNAIYNWLYHFCFIQEIDGLEACARRMNLLDHLEDDE